MYLIPSDYDYQIRQEIKTILAGESPFRLERAEKAACDQMKSYLQRRYDVDKLFPIIEEWNEQETYAIGNLSFWKLENDPDDKYLAYQCINIPSTTPDDASTWKVYTERNSFAIMYLVDITLYHLMSRFPKHFEVRSERYKEALDWLKGVAAGELDANLPQKDITNTQTQPFIRWGSHEAENNRW